MRRILILLLYAAWSWGLSSSCCFMLYADCMSQRGLDSCLHQWKHDIYILVHCLYRTPKFAWAPNGLEHFSSNQPFSFRKWFNLVWNGSAKINQEKIPKKTKSGLIWFRVAGVSASTRFWCAGCQITASTEMRNVRNATMWLEPKLKFEIYYATWAKL